MKRKSPPRSVRGFTLIEVLVTTSLFSIVMSVLLVGVFTGTRAWDRADRTLERRALIRMALEQFRDDVEHAQVASMEAVQAVLDAEGRPVWTAPTSETRPGAPWRGGIVNVEWVCEKSDESLDWIRRSQPMLGEEPVGAGETETMVAGVEDIELEFRQEGVWVGVTDPEAEAPDRVRLRLETVEGSGHEVVARLYPGVYEGPAGESGRGDPDDPSEGGEPGDPTEPGGTDDGASGGTSGGTDEEPLPFHPNFNGVTL